MVIEESDGPCYIYFKSAKFRMAMRKYDIEASHAIAGAVTRAVRAPQNSLEAEKLTTSAATCRNYSQIEGSRYPLQLRWWPLAAAEAGAAASGAAGMPVRWLRRPAAVLEAVAAGAGPDFSCSAGQKRAAKPPIGEVRSLSVVCVSVSGSVGGVRSCGRSSPFLVVLGGSPASDWEPGTRKKRPGWKEVRSCPRLPIWGPVRVPVGMSPPSSAPSFAKFRCLRRRRPGSRAT